MRSQGPSDLRKNGVALIDTHTGFKFIGDKICEFEETGSHTFPALRLLPSGAVCMPRLPWRKPRTGVVLSRRLRAHRPVAAIRVINRRNFPDAIWQEFLTRVANVCS